VAQGEVLEGKLPVATAEEREEAEQVEQRADHRSEILPGQSRPINHVAADGVLAKDRPFRRESILTVATEGFAVGRVSTSQFRRWLAWIGTALVAVSWAGYIIYRWIFFGVPVAGFTSTIVAVLFLGAVQLIVLGLIGEYLGRVYTESQRRPLYIVKTILG